MSYKLLQKGKARTMAKGFGKLDFDHPKRRWTRLNLKCIEKMVKDMYLPANVLLINDLFDQGGKAFKAEDAEKLNDICDQLELAIRAM
jgi:hypothetical protein